MTNLVLKSGEFSMNENVLWDSHLHQTKQAGKRIGRVWLEKRIA
jgi:hypothetical protein